MRLQEIITEAPLPPEAQQVLLTLKKGIEQPGIQLTDPKIKEPLTVAQTLDRSQLPKLQAQIKNLERLMAMFVEFEQLVDRAERSRTGINRGLAADLEVIKDWPTPETDEEITAYANKVAQGIQLIRNYLARQRAVWR